MSSATKRKHVFSEVQDLKLPQENEQIVRVLRSCGNNLHEVETSEGATFLVSMPTKFRKNVWVKRGDYILVQPIQEGDKVKAEMAASISPTYLKYLKAQNVWPSKFDNSSGIEDDSGDLIENSNHPPCIRRDSSSESDSE